MKEPLKIERGDTKGILNRYFYDSPEMALSAYVCLPESVTGEMAEVYQQAFGGYPWFERFACVDCGTFAKTDTCCASCKGTQFREAYPTDELIENDFPKMLTEFTPGVLLTVQDSKQKLLGFSTGGFTTLERLIEMKYRGNEEILKSIESLCGISKGARIFYDNETCVAPERQREGWGRFLGEARVNAAMEFDADMICGRSINLPWLALKEKQLGQAGYSFTSYIPQADTYQMNGVRRQFYLARKA